MLLLPPTLSIQNHPCSFFALLLLICCRLAELSSTLHLLHPSLLYVSPCSCCWGRHSGGSLCWVLKAQKQNIVFQYKVFVSEAWELLALPSEAKTNKSVEQECETNPGALRVPQHMLSRLCGAAPCLLTSACLHFTENCPSVPRGCWKALGNDSCEHSKQVSSPCERRAPFQLSYPVVQVKSLALLAV